VEREFEVAFLPAIRQQFLDKVDHPGAAGDRDRRAFGTP
jgi:hypothetical protein